MAISWPTNVNYILDRNSFGLDPNDQVARSDFDDGPQLVRMRFTHPTYIYSGSITMTNSEFMTFTSFYKNVLAQGTRWFNVPVWVGNSYVINKVRFKDKYTVTDAGFDQYTVGVQWEVREYFTYSITAVYFSDIYGIDATVYVADKLQKIVNIDYPHIWISKPALGTPTGLLLTLTQS